MKTYLTPLLPFQRLFVPALVLLFVWALWRTVFKKDLPIGLALYLALVIIVDGFMNTGLYLPGFDKGSIRYSEIWAVFLFFNAPSREPRQSSFGFLVLLVAGYFALMIVAAFRADFVLPAVMEFRATLVPQMVALAVAVRTLRTSDDCRRFIKALAAIALFVGLFSFWDVFFDRWIIKSDMLDKGIYAHNRELGRFGSIFLNPNYLGAFVTLVFPGVFVWALNEERLKMRLYAVTALLALVFSLVETQSRAPLIAFGIGTLLLMVGPCGHVTRARRIGFLAAFVVVLAIVLPGFYTRAIGRFDEIEVETSRENALSRQTTWEYSMRIIAEHPLTGIGFGEPQFMRAMNDAGFGNEFGIQSLDAPHNSYIQAAVYAGLPALALFLLANAVLLGKAVFYLSRPGVRDPATAFGLFVGIVGFLMSIFPDIQLFTPNLGAVYWVLFGILLTLLTNAPERLASAASASVAAAPATVRPTMWQPQVPERSSRVSPAYLAALEARRRERQ